VPSCDVLLLEGGERRRDSVEAGLRTATTQYVAIHDGARPLVEAELIDRVIAAAEGQAGAIAATRVTDTVKEVENGIVCGHPARSRLWAAQTPQVIIRQSWLDAAATSDDDETDDAAMLARIGLACVVVESGPWNMKITRPEDIALAEALLRQSARVT
jgi:2-C-methyl-D-erythritol 4-phosphate cytidylyltransferase